MSWITWAPLLLAMILFYNYHNMRSSQGLGLKYGTCSFFDRNLKLAMIIGLARVIDLVLRVKWRQLPERSNRQFMLNFLFFSEIGTIRWDPLILNQNLLIDRFGGMFHCLARTSLPVPLPGGFAQ